MRDLQTLRTKYRVSDFVAWQRDGALELNPNFQRRPVWKKGAKSYLIDTILRGLPMPIIFLRDLRSDLKTFKSKRDVVDGQQRIRTILSFIDPSLISNFDPDRDDFAISATHNKEWGGKRFKELSKEAQQRILDYQFSRITPPLASQLPASLCCLVGAPAQPADNAPYSWPDSRRSPPACRPRPHIRRRRRLRGLGPRSSRRS